MPIIITLFHYPKYKRYITIEECRLCNLLVDLLDDDGIIDVDTINAELPIDTINPETMDLVLSFLKYHAKFPMKKILLPLISNEMNDLVDEWDASFIQLEDNQTILVNLLRAANYLHCQNLLDLGIAKLGTMLRGKSIEEQKKIFNIHPDITPDEEEFVRENNQDLFHEK
jgi:hypothetical protein